MSVVITSSQGPEAVNAAVAAISAREDGRTAEAGPAPLIDPPKPVEQRTTTADGTTTTETPAAPETKPAEAKPETPPAEAAKPEDKAKPEEKAKPAPKPETIEVMQERISRLTHQRYTTEAQRDAAEAEVRRLSTIIESLQKTGGQPQTPPTPQDTYTPKPMPQESEIGSKYKDYTEFTAAMAQWAVDESTARTQFEMDKRDRQRQQSQQQAQQEQAATETVQAFQSRAAEFAKSTPDYNEKIGEMTSQVQIPPMAQAHILDSEMGPELVYHLATNADDLKKLLDLKKGGAQIAFLGRLEGRIEAAKQKGKAETETPVPEAVVKKLVTQAPEPITPVTTTPVTMRVDPQPDGSNYSEWRKQRDAELANRRRR